MRRPTEHALWSFSLVVAATAGVVIHSGVSPAETLRSPGSTASRSIPVADRLALARRAERVAANNPFRLSRRPADQALIEAREMAELAPQYEEQLPPVARLELAGVTGGPPWAALIDGLPGRESSVVFLTGDTINGVVALRITRDTVVLAGPDSTYVLTARRPWP